MTAPSWDAQQHRRDYLEMAVGIPSIIGFAVLTCWATAERIWLLAGPLWVGWLLALFYIDSTGCRSNVDPGERWD